MFTRFSTILAAVATVVVVATPAAAQYTVTDLGDLGGGASIATAVNNRGQVVGISVREDFTQAGFIWQNGVMTDLGSLGGSSTIAYAINARGQVVGGAQRLDGSIAAFVWQNGTMTEILPGENAYAYGINERGQVTGQMYADDFSTSNGAMCGRTAF